MIRGTGVTYCHTYIRRRLILCFVLAMKTRQVPTENNINHIRAKRNSSKGLPNEYCEMQWQNFANIEKKKQLLDLQCLQQNHSSAVLLQTQLCSISRTCIFGGTCLVFLASPSSPGGGGAGDEATLYICTRKYRIAGNFRMVQIFVYFECSLRIRK